jgi:UDP-N-acetylglucosamine 1-carboxyvinyltransferase
VGTAARVTVRRDLRAADCIMLPYPGLATDVQAQLMALLTTIPGISIITDKVFPDRFMHASELARMGASIRREGPSAIINGVGALSGASVMASDLRASAALVLAALAAHGDSVVRRIYHLDRGYDRLELKLNDLGAGIVRAQDIPLNMPASLSISPAELASDDGDHELRGPKWLRVRENLRIHFPEEAT